MIKINLAKRRSAQAFAQGNIMQKMGISWDDLQELPLRTIAIVLVTAWLASDRMEAYQNSKMQTEDQIIEELTKKEKEILLELGKTKDYDAQKRQLESDEVALRGKIETIEKLITDRNHLYNTLVSLTTAIPKDVWLNSFTLKDGVFSVIGSSLDLNLVSDFMKHLGETPYFKDINLKKTDQSKDSSGLEIANFELVAKFK